MEEIFCDIQQRWVKYTWIKAKKQRKQTLKKHRAECDTFQLVVRNCYIIHLETRKGPFEHISQSIVDRRRRKEEDEERVIGDKPWKLDLLSCWIKLKTESTRLYHVRKKTWKQYFCKLIHCLREPYFAIEINVEFSIEMNNIDMVPYVIF